MVDILCPISQHCLAQTAKAVHIVITTEKDGRKVTNLERKIPLVTIRSIAMSNLRDDWMVGYFMTFGTILTVFKVFELQCFRRRGSYLQLLL